MIQPSLEKEHMAKCLKEEANPARKKQKPLGMGSKLVNLNRMNDTRMVEVEITESTKDKSEKQDREVRKEQTPQKTMEK